MDYFLPNPRKITCASLKRKDNLGVIIYDKIIYTIRDRSGKMESRIFNKADLYGLGDTNITPHIDPIDIWTLALTGKFIFEINKLGSKEEQDILHAAKISWLSVK